MVTRDGCWLQPARDSSFGMEDLMGGCMGHSRNRGAHGGASGHFVWIGHMTRSSSPSEEVLFLFPCTSLAFQTLFDVLLWRPNQKGNQWMQPFGSFTSLDSSKEVLLPKLTHRGTAPKAEHWNCWHRQSRVRQRKSFLLLSTPQSSHGRAEGRFLWGKV